MDLAENVTPESSEKTEMAVKYRIPKTRPEWYLRFFRTVEGTEEKRHKCVECGFEGMAVPYALTNLLRHFAAAKYHDCGEKYKAWKTQNQETKNRKTLLVGSPTRKGKVQNKICSCSTKIDNKEIDEKLGDLFVFAELPFTFVKLGEFIKFCQSLNPAYTIPSIYKLKNNILKKKRFESDSYLRNELAHSPFVTITIDGWSTRRLVSMMGIIVHYHGETYAKASVLSIALFRGPHTGERIARFTIDTCNDWCIANKIVRVGTDNGSNMVKAFSQIDELLDLDESELPEDYIYEEDYFDGYNESLDNFELQEIDKSIMKEAVENLTEELEETSPQSLLVGLRKDGLLPLWFPCVCHTAQLAVKDFLKTDLGNRGEINAIVKKAQEFVKSAKSSTKCAEIFMEKGFNLMSMNATRWNSMYDMLRSIISADEKELIDLLPPLKSEVPKKYEINIFREVCDVLQPITLFTSEMQATHGTSGMTIPALEMVMKELQNGDLNMMDNSLASILSNILKKRFQNIMSDKFYWLANCLDPRFATEAYENELFMEILRRALKIVSEINRNKGVRNEIQENADKETGIWSKAKKSLFPTKRYSDSNTQLYCNDVIDMEITLFKAEARAMQGIISIDPIKWWMHNSTKFPLMSQLAMVYLLPPASTADVERLFSVAGRICRPHRSRLSPESIELLVTLKHRMLSDNRNSERADKPASLHGNIS